MNKNKKILLTIITILLSTILFTNRVDAVVMWMQCTDSPDEKLECGNDCDNYGLYNTFALIHYENNGLRNLAYNPNDFYSGKKPVYVMAEDTGGALVGNSCWYESYFNDIEECDKEQDKMIPISKMLEGICPTGVRKNDHFMVGAAGIVGKGWVWSNTVKDFIVIYGTKNANESESLNENMLVIYGFKESDSQETSYMIEGYDSSGNYGYATTWEDWKSFEKNLDLSISDDVNDLISEEQYSKKHMTWTGMTQARRVATLGRNYFKLLDTEDAWLINTQENSKFEKSNSLTIYRSDDSNKNFYNWVSSWFEKYDEELSKQIKAIENLKSEKYKKTYAVAKEINEAVNSGKKYTFEKNYSASQMLQDLNDAYQELSIMLNNNESMYEYYDKSCNLVTDKKTNDALAAMTTQFNCENFNVSSLNYLQNKTNPSMLNKLIVSSLSTALNQHSKSDISIETIQNTAEEYEKLFAVAIKYIQKNGALTSEDQSVANGLEEKYNEMSKNIGSETIIDCEDLISKELIEKIDNYLNIVKILVPLLLITFGIVDFSKAMLAGNEDNMKKAQKDFLLRIGIAILFFLTPTIVNFLLEIANKVWNFIEPNSCGIFS